MEYTKEVKLATEDHYFVIEKDDGDNTTIIQVTELDKESEKQVEVALTDPEVEEFIEALQLFKKKGDETNYETIGFRSE
ncbi:hypothetical protein GI584_14415 [Gracilibacillus salitolerans]|uniref:Uncharacterized protein n=1 Tax=Gracilibacillus salitolerans TaxID=2663022 RepID=A0A5Q2TK98_9BACI|nr:hypothetical protein [Gracilibacillus salitolerans]QGH35166.1 hypothetical protein GI584_14415 [Gracilibacillus salitolerans]